MAIRIMIVAYISVLGRLAMLHILSLSHKIYHVCMILCQSENMQIYTSTPKVYLIFVSTCFLKDNLVYLTVINQILFDNVVHIKIMFWRCLF